MSANAQTGVASWYGPENYRSSTGKRLTNKVPALAHKTLPIGTKVKVTELKTKKSIIAVVEDRGPYTKNRIVDLNKIAAQKLGMINIGITKVKIEKL
jgi:rare lipoprotein A